MNTAAKLLSILRLYSLEKSEWTVEEAAGELGVSVSTAYRYFRSLCKAGLLDPFNGNAYILGPAIIEHDRHKRLSDPLIKAGQPVIRRLVARSGCPGVALLCRIYRNCVMCVDQQGEFGSNGAISYERGLPMPMFRGASSKIILANLPSRSVRWFFENYSREMNEAGLGHDWEAVKANLRQIRKAGVLVARGEVDRHRVGVAAPIIDPEGRVLGSVSMVIMEEQATPQTVANVSALVEAAGREIHAALLLLHAKPVSLATDAVRSDSVPANNFTESGK